jgi:hypothetical protein
MEEIQDRKEQERDTQKEQITVVNDFPGSPDQEKYCEGHRNDNDLDGRVEKRIILDVDKPEEQHAGNRYDDG